MSIIAFIIVLLVFFGNSESSHYISDDTDYFVPDLRNSNTHTSWTNNTKTNGCVFEEDDSVFDCHGNEHIIDDDRYCEDCEDYHDW